MYEESEYVRVGGVSGVVRGLTFFDGDEQVVGHAVVPRSDVDGSRSALEPGEVPDSASRVDVGELAESLVDDTLFTEREAEAALLTEVYRLDREDIAGLMDVSGSRVSNLRGQYRDKLVDARGTFNVIP